MSRFSGVLGDASQPLPNLSPRLGSFSLCFYWGFPTFPTFPTFLPHAYTYTHARVCVRDVIKGWEGWEGWEAAEESSS